MSEKHIFDNTIDNYTNDYTNNYINDYTNNNFNEYIIDHRLITNRFTETEISGIKELIMDARKEINKIKKYFNWFLDILNQYNIEYFAAYGTLLATIRDQSVIPWDDDYDLYITLESKNTLFEKLELCKKTNETMMNIEDYKIPDNFVINGDEKVILGFPCIIDNKRVNILFTHSPWHFYQVWIFNENFKYICKVVDIFYQYRSIAYDSPDLYPIIKKQIDGVEICVMNNYKQILESAYGNNYMNEYFICNHKIAETFFHKDRNKYIKLNRNEFKSLMSIINQ